LADIEYLAFMHPDFDKLPPSEPEGHVQSLGRRGVLHQAPKLPKVPLGKWNPGGDPMMTEYVVMHVFAFPSRYAAYQAAQANRNGAGWRSPGRAAAHRLLGFGMMARAPAMV